MSEQAWIFVADRQNWIECVNIGSFGLSVKPGRLKLAKAGDPCAAYLRGESSFFGIGQLLSTYYYDETQVWEDGMFPHRVRINIDLDFDNKVDVRSIVHKLDFITDKDHWSVFFRGGVFKIPLSDFETIKAAIEKGKVQAQVFKKPSGETQVKDLRQTILSLPELTTQSLHDRIAEMIHVVGLHKGYDSVQRYKTRPDSPYIIDVVWLQNKNPQIAVEVHHEGILGDALDRLRHARDFNFRKVVLVLIKPGDHKRTLDILKFDEKLKHVIDLWSINSVYNMYDFCVSFHKLYSRFEQSAYREKPDQELI